MKIQNFKLLFSATVQPGLCRTWSETKIVVFLMPKLIVSVMVSVVTSFSSGVFVFDCLPGVWVWIVNLNCNNSLT